MDTTSEAFSTTQIAKRLGVSVPTIHRAVARLNLVPSRGSKGHLRLSGDDARILLEDLGKAPRVEGFTRQELFVLHVLSFYLAGGTGLVLRLHHRRSTDLEFFCHSEFDPQEILDALVASKHPVSVLDISPGGSQHSL